MFKDYVMYQALMIEAEGQDIQKAALYAQGFSRASGIAVTKLVTAAKDFTPRDYSPKQEKGKGRGARYPADWPAVDYGD
jgi:hypothetical protein